MDFCDSNQQPNKENDLERQPLPLEWTRVQRRPRSTSALKKHSDDVNDGETAVPRIRSSRENCTEVACTCRQNVDDSALFDLSEQDTNNSQCTYYSGSVVFCLPDADCDWFQGYFFPFNDNDDTIDPMRQSSRFQHKYKTTTEQKPYYGLLCHVKRDIDECLQCAAGGYREISIMEMTLMNYNGPQQQQQQQQEQDSSLNNSDTPQEKPLPRRMNITNIYWLGGDMMNLSMTNSTATTSAELSKSTNPTATSSNTTIINAVSMLRMKATTLYTGTNAMQHILQYFSSLIRRLLQEENEMFHHGEDDDINNDIPHQKENHHNNLQSLDESMIQQLMPNVAIVVGIMDMWMPN
jgi:hypothetical protein